MLGLVRLITPTDDWLQDNCFYACLVKDWEVIIVQSIGDMYLHGWVVRDPHKFFSRGDIVLERIKRFSEDAGIVESADKAFRDYFLQGPGEELTVSEQEYCKVKKAGLSLRTDRLTKRGIG